MNRLLPKKTVAKQQAKHRQGRRKQEVLTSFRIPRSLYKQIQELSRRLDRPQSWIIREATQSWVTWKLAEPPASEAPENNPEDGGPV